MDNLLQQLSNAVTFSEDLKHPPVFDYSQFHGVFRKKMEDYLVWRKQKTAAISVKTFSWKQCEIGEYTGNQLLRILVALCRTLNSFLLGTCIVLTINGDPDAAMYLLGPKWIEIKTPSPQDPEKRRYYDKIFNDRLCRSMKGNFHNSQYFTDEKLNEIRAKVPRMLKSFLQQPFGDTSPEYRHTFIGMLQELAKFEMNDVTVYDLTRQVPVASCIWLAIHHSMSHKLQSVFGDHQFPKQEFFKRWRMEDPLISMDELLMRLSVQKSQERLDAAKAILSRTIPVDSDGSYDTHRFKQIVNEVKELFQVSASYSI